MILFIKKNKVLSFLIIISFLSFILGLLLPSMMRVEEKEKITNNIIQLQETITQNKLHYKNTTIFSNSIYIIFIWFLGISIIGIPIILFIYFLKVLLLSLEIVFFLLNIGKIKISIIFFYLFPNIINILLYFLLIYYALNFSIFLIQILFLKKNYIIKNISRRYLKILVITFILNIINSLIEIYLIPNILLIFK